MHQFCAWSIVHKRENTDVAAHWRLQQFNRIIIANLLNYRTRNTITNAREVLHAKFLFTETGDFVY